MVNQATPAAVHVEELTKTYGTGRQAVTALAGVTATFHSGTFTAVMGPSGSGKSTLLQTAAGLDRPTGGRVWIGDAELSRLSETRLTELRRTRAGFVFQAFNLIGALTVEENILLPLRLAGVAPEQGWVRHVIERVGLGDRLGHRPAELSGGQQQRVAIARALATRPDVIFCDEPTGALDTQTAAGVLVLLRWVVDEARQTVIMVTHDPVAASYADRVLVLADGRIRHDLPQPGAERIAELLARPRTAMGADRSSKGGDEQSGRVGEPNRADRASARVAEPSRANEERADRAVPAVWEG